MSIPSRSACIVRGLLTTKPSSDTKNSMQVPALPSRGRAANDQSVQGTNDDAQVSKLSCVNLKYFEDPFIQHFVKRGCRRSPLINRGYYSRTAALRQLLYQFLAAGYDPETRTAPAKQVLSLGAGFDTNFFRLKAEGLAPAKYLEVDFREVTSKKAGIISHTPALHSLLEHDANGVLDAEQGRIVTQQYTLLPVDLRDTDALGAALSTAGFDLAAPTYVLSECVLVYMDPPASTALVNYLGRTLNNAVFVVYEQIKPDDAFGRQMVTNLESRGCPLKGVHQTSSLAAHCARLTSNHWQRAEARDMDTVYRCHLDPADKLRAERLEIFDEFEEWHMIQEHYCVAIGINDVQGLFEQFGFPATRPSSFQQRVPLGD